LRRKLLAQEAEAEAEKERIRKHFEEVEAEKKRKEEEEVQRKKEEQERLRQEKAEKKRLKEEKRLAAANWPATQNGAPQYKPKNSEPQPPKEESKTQKDEPKPPKEKKEKRNKDTAPQYRPKQVQPEPDVPKIQDAPVSDIEITTPALPQKVQEEERVHSPPRAPANKQPEVPQVPPTVS